MGKELWKPIPGYGAHYEASNFGRIRVLPRTIVRRHPKGREKEFFYGGHLLSPAKRSRYGHLSVTLGQDGVDKSVFVHRLVLLAFVGQPAEGQVACHGNGDPADNRPDNLRCDTVAANNADRKAHGNYAVGAAHHCAKLDEATVIKMRASGLNYAAVSEKYGISRSQAHRILRGTSWSYLNELIGRLAA